MWLRGTNFCINRTSSARFELNFIRRQNGPKCTQTVRNLQKHEFSVQWGGRMRSLPKIPTRLRGMNFCINHASSAHFEPSFLWWRNGPKGTQTVWNSPKHEFRVQWGGSGAFIAKNYDPTSWHEHLHWLHQFFPFWIEFHKMTKRSQMHPKHYETHLNISLGYNGVDWV